MLRDYKDIIDRLGPPQWWDDNGCPRYCDFAPYTCGVYDEIVALIEIACQACGERFRVVVSYDRMSMWRREENAETHRREIFPTAESINAFHFGDPPPHGCVGDTMNCDTYRVLEFWRRKELPEWGWERAPEYEVTYEQYVESSEGGRAVKQTLFRCAAGLDKLAAGVLSHPTRGEAVSGLRWWELALLVIVGAELAIIAHGLYFVALVILALIRGC